MSEPTRLRTRTMVDDVIEGLVLKPFRLEIVDGEGLKMV